MTVLGAIFPDAFVSNKLNHDDTHNFGWNMYRFYQEKEPELIDFVISAMTHTISPKGLDYYGDGVYGEQEGYCFLKAESIVDEVVDACNIPKEYGLWKAHNFIEMAVELEVLNDNKQLLKQLDEALHDDLMMYEIESYLETFYSLEHGFLKNCFKRFKHFVYKEDISSRVLSIKYDHHMKLKHGINIDIDKASKIIDKAKYIIKDDYIDFFITTEKKVKEMLSVRMEI